MIEITKAIFYQGNEAVEGAICPFCGLYVTLDAVALAEHVRQHWTKEMDSRYLYVATKLDLDDGTVS